MSQKSTKIKITNNLSTSQGRRASERSTRVFGGARDPSVQETVFLYKLVFNTRKAVLLSVLLLLCFVSQPFQNVYAEETTADIVPASAKVEIPPEFTQETVKAEVISEAPSQKSEEISTDVSKDIALVDNGPPEVIATDQEPEKATSSSAVVVSKSASTTKVVSAVTEASASSSEIINIDTSSIVSTSTQKSTSTLLSDESSGGTSGGSGTTDSNEDQTPDEELDSDTTASSTEITDVGKVDNEEVSADDNSVDEINDEVGSGSGVLESADVEISDEVDEVGTNDNLVSYVESDSQFSFLKSECTRIEEGSFYCQKKDSSVHTEDSLVAAPDADGDLEIYLVRDGERTQITHNKVDDASPYYDEYSKTIVWHRLVNDRYQIISYDTNTGKEVQLTDTDVNNMEPTRHGEYTVWQRWVHDNWEIMLFDGSKEKQITNSSRHDIAPHVRGPLIIWNSRSNDGTQSLMTYDIKDRTYTTIADGEGVSVSNPRLMVMYEAMYENGDVVMKGFDVVTGKIMPLQSLPQELPTDLPNTDSTGETRALIQTKPAPKQSEIVNNNETTSSGSSTPPILPDIDIDQTLDLRATSTVDIEQVNEVFESPTSTIPDLVVPIATSSPDTSSSSQTTAES